MFKIPITSNTRPKPTLIVGSIAATKFCLKNNMHTQRPIHSRKAGSGYAHTSLRALYFICVLEILNTEITRLSNKKKTQNVVRAINNPVYATTEAIGCTDVNRFEVSDCVNIVSKNKMENIYTCRCRRLIGNTHVKYNLTNSDTMAILLTDNNYNLINIMQYLYFLSVIYYLFENLC